MLRNKQTCPQSGNDNAAAELLRHASNVESSGSEPDVLPVTPRSRVSEMLNGKGFIPQSAFLDARCRNRTCASTLARSCDATSPIAPSRHRSCPAEEMMNEEC